MSSFIFDSVSLPTVKSDIRAVSRSADPTRYFAATDFNQLRQALYDARSGIIAGSFHGLAPQTVRPTPPAGSSAQFAWVRASDGHLIYFDGAIDHDLSGSTTIATGQLAYGISANSIGGSSALSFVPVSGLLTIAGSTSHSGSVFGGTSGLTVGDSASTNTSLSLTTASAILANNNTNTSVKVDSNGVTVAGALITNGLLQLGTSAAAPSVAGQFIWDGTNFKFTANGTTWTNLGSGTGTVTSIALTAPSFLTVSGSPVTASGALGLTLATQAANTIFRGPSTGAAAAPTFGALVAADLPTSGVTAGSYTVPSITVDVAGRITAASNGTAGVTFPLVDSSASNLLVTVTPHLTMENTTAATGPGTTNITRQDSPALVLAGRAWNGSASIEDGYAIKASMLSLGGSYSALSIQRNTGGGAFAEIFRIGGPPSQTCLMGPAGTNSAGIALTSGALWLFNSITDITSTTPQVVMTGTALYPYNASGLTLGTAASYWGTVFSNKLTLASNAAAPSAAGEFVWDGTNFKYTVNGTTWTNLGAAGGVTWPLTNGTSSNTYTSAIANGATAVAHTFDSTNALSTAGSKLASFRTGTTEKLFVGGDGAIGSSAPISFSPSGNAGSVRIAFDAGNNFGAVGGATGTSAVGFASGYVYFLPSGIGSANGWFMGAGIFSPVLDFAATIGAPTRRATEVWSRRYAGVEQTIAAAASITLDPAAGESIRITLGATGITTVNGAAGYPGETIRVQVIQDAGGAKTISGWSTAANGFKFSGGAYAATATGSKRDVLTFVWDSVAAMWIEASRSMAI